MMRFACAVAALTAVYALALASADPWDLGIGVVLSVGVLAAFRRFIFCSAPELAPGRALKRAAHFPQLAVATAANVVRGTAQVTRAVLGWSTMDNAGFVEIPQGDRTETGVVVSGLLDTLSPGTVLVEIDPEARTWTIHALQGSDEEEVRGDLERFYDRFQRPVWP